MSPGSVIDTEDAVTTLATLGIDGAGHVPRSVGVVDFTTFDHVVAMNPSVARELRKKPVGAPTLVEWDIEDPYKRGLPVSARCAAQIQECV